MTFPTQTQVEDRSKTPLFVLTLSKSNRVNEPENEFHEPHKRPSLRANVRKRLGNKKKERTYYTA